MGAPGEVVSLVACGGNGGAFFSFMAPVVTGTNEQAVSYGYYFIINDFFPTPAVIWIPPAGNTVGPYDIPYYDTLPSGTKIVMKITANGPSGSGPETTSNAVTTVDPLLKFPMCQLLDANTLLTLPQSELTPIPLSTTAPLTPVTIPAEYSASFTSSTVRTSLTTSTQAGNFSSGSVDFTLPEMSSLVSNTTAQVGSDYLLRGGISVAGVDTFGQDLTSTVRVDFTYPSMSDGIIIEDAQLWVNRNNQGEFVSSFTVTPVDGGETTLSVSVNVNSIYLIYIKFKNGASTVTIPVENNQAYNDYLHDESGYQNRRTNRLLTSGFYRGPVDSSTLTRIRAANGVLLGVPGVPGGMQGSRCCP